MKKNRIKFIINIFFIALLLLAARLFYLQIFKGQEYAISSSAQRISNLEFERPRGNILDRNFISFTNREPKVILVVKPLYLRNKDDDIKKLSEILGENFNMIRRKIYSFQTPMLFEIDEDKKEAITDMKLAGISTIYSLKRYNEDTLAKHILGYLNKIDQVGQAGLENFYQEVLETDNKKTIGVVTDARNNLVEGLGYRVFDSEEQSSNLNIKLTIDYHIQKIVENSMKEKNLTGAIIIEDILNGDIVAIASKPDFNPNKVEEYLYSNNKALFNRAVASYNLGSIFKIIVAAKALENNIELGDEYYCSGKIDVGENEFKCHTYNTGGHGKINFEQAFAQSCNTYFINLGLKVGYQDIIEMASRFGIGEKTGIVNQGILESAGNLPSVNSYYSTGDIANISIGQGGIMVTPLQAVNFAAIIANGGIRNSMNIVDSIVDKEGNIIRSLKVNKGERIISKEIADKIKSMMVETVNTGTGKLANIDSYGGAGGKTGSAETGQFIGDKKIVHAWFVGFFPIRQPKYAVCVFVENGQTGGGAAAPFFSTIAEKIMDKGY